MGTDKCRIEELQDQIQQQQSRISELEEAELQSKATIQAIKSRENTLGSIFNVAPAGIGMIRNRVFIETNPAVTLITGYSREELLGFNSRIIYPNTEVYEAVGKEIYRQVELHGTGTIETTWQRKDGKLIDVYISLTPLNNLNVDQGIIFTAQDITEQNKAKKQIESSEEQLKIIFNHAPDAIFLCDLEGSFVDVNIAAENMVKQNKDHLIGHSLFMPGLIADKDIPSSRKILDQNNRRQKTGPTLLEVNTAKGEKVPIEVTTYPIEINEKLHLLGVARNISERIRAEEIKRENEQRIAFHYNQTQLAVIEWNLDFTVKNWNKAAENIFGYTKDEALGQHASFILPTASRDEVNKSWSNVKLSKNEGRLTNKNSTKAGDIIICDWHNTPLKNENGDLVAVASFAMNVTEAVRSEEIKQVIYNISNAVNSTENLNKLTIQIREELASIIDTTNFYIALYDKETDTLSLPFFADEKDEFKNFPARKSLTGHVVRSNKPLLANKQKMAELEQLNIIDSVGTDSEIWLGVPLEIDNVVIGALAVQSYTNQHAFNEADMKMLEFVSDQISLSIHRKNTEEKMAAALEKATESDRLKSSFLANMSHEIRTPMNGILGFSNLLKNNDLSKDDRIKYISIIEQSGKRMLGIINDLIDISKIESGITELNLSDFNLNNSLEYVHSFFKPEAEAKGLKLSYSTTLSNEAALIQSDREKVYAILINLVKNAIKYTSAGQIDFGYIVQKNTIRFNVSDTGIGIPKEKQESIFNRFVQADLRFTSSYEGVGLGLAITKAYVEFLGGKIWMESEQLQGSTFYIEIPYIKGQELIKTSKNTEEHSMNNKENCKIKILLAEDDAINRKLFSYILKNISSELIQTVNGRDAVDKHAEISNIDVILMDLKMPEMDGYEATRIIREKDKDIKIIGLSAFALETEKNKALERGFDDYISKPVSKATLLNTLKKHFDI